MYAEPDFTLPIIGGCIGGLVLLILIAAGLYKVRHCTYTDLVWNNLMVTLHMSYNYYLRIVSYNLSLTFLVLCSQAGFFKSKYQQMIKENAGEDNPGVDVNEPELT